MIITILQSSKTFAGVDYNERKVAKGTAELIEMKNFGFLENIYKRNSNLMRKYLIEYSATNDRIKNTQFHVAISCRGNEYSHEELQKIAHDYLKEMGYEEQGQPLLIYAHHDTDNNHIHIITSRVNPQRKKIQDSNERINTQKFIDKIMKIDNKKETQTILSKALLYKFENVSQFKAILENSGYECYEDNENILIKKGGTVNGKISIKEIENKIQTNYTDEKRKKQLKAIIIKYRDMSANKEELATTLNEKFGVNLIFVGKKDKPYGYMIIDNKEKSVYKGSTVLPLKNLLLFQSKKERQEKIDMSIDAILEDVNNLTTREINKMLNKQFGTKLINGQIVIGEEKITLPKHIIKTIKANDKLAWLQSFNPSNENEKTVLCTLGKIKKEKERNIKIDETHKVSQKDIDLIKDKLNKIKEQNYKDMRALGINIYMVKNHYYIVDFDNKNIVDAKKYGIKINIKNNEQMNIQTQQISTTKMKQLLNQNNNSSAQNREFEVGRNGNYENIDDSNKLKQ